MSVVYSQCGGCKQPVLKCTKSLALVFAFKNQSLGLFFVGGMEIAESSITPLFVAMRHDTFSSSIRTPPIRACLQTGRGPLMWYGLDLGWAYRDLLASIFRQTRCQHTAYDLLHDAMIRFALARHRDSVDEPHAYMRKIVSNIISDHFNASARLVSLSDDFFERQEAGQGDADAAMLQNFAVSPEYLADLQQRIAAIETIISGLPARCREVFWLFRIEGLRQRDIATRLGISLNMVERHVIRALVDLSVARDLLND